MQYFIISNGTQMGPFSKEELRSQNINIDTMVWHEGMAEWAKAATVPELADILANNSQNVAPPAPAPSSSYRGGNQYGQQGYSNQSGNPYNTYQNNPYDGYQGGMVPHTNWMTWAIIATVLGFCTSCIGGIIGIFAIVNANKANNYYNMGMAEQGAAENSTAKTLTIIALVLDIIGIIFCGLYFLGLFALAL